MVISVFAGAFAIGVLVLMVMTRSGQPLVRRTDPNGSSFIWFGDGGGGDSGCGSDGGGGCDGGGGGGGGV
jgi:hypothetical protein